MALKDLSLSELLDLAQTGIDRMRSDDHLEQLMGLSFLGQIQRVIADRLMN
jgi:hypothetical protein